MSRWEAWTVHLSMLLVGGTGLVYAWMRYLMEPVDEFSIVNHPWQPAVQHAHIWLAPLLVFAAGLIWREHIWKHWNQGRKGGRRSGLLLLFTLVPMVLSGYLIQTTITETWRNVWIVVHLVASGLWILGYAIHVYARFGRKRRLRNGKKNGKKKERRPQTAPGGLVPPKTV